MMVWSVTLHVAMMGFERSDDYQPLFWVRGRPIHVATLLVILHCGSLVICSLAPSLLHLHLGRWMNFSSTEVLRGHAWWQVVTYNFYHQPSIWFLLDMAFLFIWGREVERYFGRRMFAMLYSALVLAAPIFLLGRALMLGTNQTLAQEGSYNVDLGVFIIFATIYPNVQFFFGIACKWFACAFVAIETLQYLSGEALNDLFVLWLDVGVAFFGARYASMGSSGFSLPEGWGIRDKFPRKTAPAGVKPRLKPRRAVDTDGGGSEDYRGRDVHESIDPLLDKISKHGLASLTNSERAVLEKARVSLLRKDKGD